MLMFIVVMVNRSIGSNSDSDQQYSKIIFGVINELCYDCDVIKSFADKETHRIFILEGSKKLPSEIQERALDRLVVLDAATSLLDLNYPAYRLEKLSGDRVGQHSILINQ